MVGKSRYFLFPLLVVFLASSANKTLAQSNRFILFDTTKVISVKNDSVLTLSEVLHNVALKNPMLKAFDFQIQSAEGNLKQAGLWPNPELSTGFEEIGWNAPGFKESEFSIELSQEFDIFGQRTALKDVARSEIDAMKVKLQQNAFDLYLDVKSSFYKLAHAQEQVSLAKNSLELARSIVENINFKMERGAALQSELLLAELETQKSELELLQAKQNVDALEYNLIAMWDGEKTGQYLKAEKEPDFELIQSKLTKLVNDIESAQEVVLLKKDINILKAEREFAIREGKPNLTLSGGFKRLEVDNSKSFLFGISLPLPFFNKNQGERMRISSEIQALEYEIEYAKLNARAKIQSSIVYLNQLIESHATLDSLLLPTSEKAYNTLKKAYEAGRVPYTQLLEAERALNELSFEHNDMLLAIQEQIMTIEKATGIVLLFDKE